MDVVLGVALGSTAPATIHTVLVCGENGDGVTLEAQTFAVPSDSIADFAAVDALIAAILQAREAADTAGHHLVSTGVTVTDPSDGAALSSRLAAIGLEDVVLISPALAAAALARNLGQTVGCDQMGLLSVESTDATLAVVDCSDGSITRLFRGPLNDGDATSAVDTAAGRFNTAQTCPDGLLLVCSGVNSGAIRPRLEATVGYEVCEPADPQVALARGAALASAQVAVVHEVRDVPGTSTAALAYTQETDSGAFVPGYYDIPGFHPGFEANDLAYSAVDDDEADIATAVIYPAAQPARRPLLVAGAVLASATFAAASALMVSLALDIAPNLVALRPDFGRALSFPLAPPKLDEPILQPYVDAPPVMSQPGALPPLDVPPAAPVSVPIPPSPDMSTVPVFGPPLQMPPPAVPVATPFITTSPPLPVRHSTPPVSRPVASGLPDLSFLLGLPAKLPAVPTPNSAMPAPPLEMPTPPVVKPDPPVIKPQPPVELPPPPVIKPQPPVELPPPPVIKPQPPVELPPPPVIKPQPPVELPPPPVIKPQPPVIKPIPPVVIPQHPVQLPEAPIKLPDPPAVNPNPPFQLPGLPMSPPKSAPPAVLPQSPAIPSLPTPKAPTIPAFNPPSLPTPNSPALPSLPVPKAPTIPGPSGSALPNLGGGSGGGIFGGKPGGGIFGGKPGGGIFGGKPGGGLFGGGHGGGLFGGGHGGGLFGGGHGGGLFGGGHGGGLFGH